MTIENIRIKLYFLVAIALCLPLLACDKAQPTAETTAKSATPAIELSDVEVENLASAAG